MITKKEIEKALKKAIDPEIGVNLVDMGLIKDIQIKGSDVKIKMALTSPFCPLANQMTEDVKEKVKSVKGVKKVNVEVLS